MDLNLANKRVLVAAASKGLGFAIADALAAEGCVLAVCSRDDASINQAADKIRKRHSVEVVADVVDVSDEDQLRAWVDNSAKTMGGLDIAIHNGGGPSGAIFDQTTPEQWDGAYRLVLRSALTFASAARPHLGGGSAVLFNTSISVREPLAGLALSTVFRAGVAALSKLLADEWAADGIRVNQLIPGRIQTDRVLYFDQHRATELGVSIDEVRSESSAKIPLNRYGTAEEYAAAAVFLVSDAASYITGASLQVDGGVLRGI
jgi:3-oxoacyl-[acyl-carrier protein] reductase